MRLFTKIFISVITVFGIAFLASGYFILSYSFESRVKREMEFALRQYKYDKFTVQAELLMDGKKSFEDIGREISTPACFISEEQEVFYTGGMEELQGVRPEELEIDSYWYRVAHKEEESFILIGSRLKYGIQEIGFITKTDFTEAVREQKMLGKYFARFFYIALGAGVLLITGLSLFLTNPIKKMTNAADRIARGSYSERIHIRGKDELGELAESFNQMAEAVEETVSELGRKAKEKEDFVSNFAHELKTPLTSVIGYADRMYQRELSHEEVKEAAWYIWNEGMHLEALASKLMDLTNLNRQEFLLAVMPAEEFLTDTFMALSRNKESEKEEVLIHCKAEASYVKADYDLLKSLMRNLTDNAVKAESENIWITGKRCKGEYCIQISDDGKGIPKEELPRITEAFYMVDKARSRRRHSAGLGLALAEKIVQIHGGRMTIDSKVGKGTHIKVFLPVVEEGDVDEDV